MRLEYKLPFRKGARQRMFLSREESEWEARPPRVARMLALAHKLDGLVRTGVVKDYVALARLAHLSPARVSQILLLLQLAPSIQEQLLFADSATGHSMAENDLRKIARRPLWNEQTILFERRLRQDNCRCV